MKKHLIFHNSVDMLNATEGVLVQKQTYGSTEWKWRAQK